MYNFNSSKMRVLTEENPQKTVTVPLKPIKNINKKTKKKELDLDDISVLSPW